MPYFSVWSCFWRTRFSCDNLQQWWLRNFMAGVKHTEQNTSTALHGTPGIEIAAEIHEVVLIFCILRELWKNYQLPNALSASKSRVLLPLPDKPPVRASAYSCGIFISLQSKRHGPKSLLHAGDMAENEWYKCQDYEQYSSQMMTAWKEKSLQRTHGLSQRQCGSTAQESHFEVKALTFMFNVVIPVPVTAGRPQRPILLLKTTLFFLFFMFKILVCLSTEVCFIKSFAQPEPPDSVCDESRAPTPGWTLQAMSKWWEIEQDWELQRLRCALWGVTRGDILRATIHCHRYMVREQAQISQEPKLDLFWNRQLSI